MNIICGLTTVLREMTNENFMKFLRRPKEKTALGRSRCRRESNIKTDLKQIWCENIDKTYLTQDRIDQGAHVNTVMNLCVPCKTR